jgi:hypothetical protein
LFWVYNEQIRLDTVFQKATDKTGLRGGRGYAMLLVARPSAQKYSESEGNSRKSLVMTTKMSVVSDVNGEIYLPALSSLPLHRASFGHYCVG